MGHTLVARVIAPVRIYQRSKLFSFIKSFLIRLSNSDYCCKTKNSQTGRLGFIIKDAWDHNPSGPIFERLINSPEGIKQATTKILNYFYVQPYSPVDLWFVIIDGSQCSTRKTERNTDGGFERGSGNAIWL